MPKRSFQKPNAVSAIARAANSNSKFTHGFLTKDWINDKEVLKADLRLIIANEGYISYRDSAAKLAHLKLHENDPRFHLLLTEISTEEDQAGRGLLTSCIIQHRGDEPGNGYYELAEKRGRKFTRPDRQLFWLGEYKRVTLANRKFLGWPPKP